MTGLRPLMSHCLGAAILLMVGGLLSMMVLRAPALAVGFAAGSTAAVVVYARTKNLPRFFLASLGGLLLGYALFGWRFASIGAPPLFVGEIILATGLLAALRLERPLWLLESPLPVLILAFMVLGALRTAPFISQYGVDALRDAVVWCYAIFALLVAAALRQTRLESTVVEQYARWVPVFLVWAPVALLIVRLLPYVPPSSPIYRISKAGDIGTHLGGALAFLLLGLHRGQHGGRGRGLPVGESVLWGFILIAAAIVAVTTRGGLLSILAPVGIVLVMRPGTAGTRAGFAGAALLLLCLLAVSADLSLSASMGREISARQLLLNFGSIFSGSMGEVVDGTREWRLMWWNQIIDYTVYGEYFWGGKGFGINLANSDGYQVLAEGWLRSPHSIHMTILARAGVPGLVVWCLLLVGFGVGLVRGYLRSRRLGADGWARVNLWIFVYWLAFLINASFDVFLEGPQGGIWFWSLMGLGIAVMQLQRHGAEPVPRPVRTGLRAG